jgi:PAS domain S-box-containing protein
LTKAPGNIGNANEIWLIGGGTMGEAVRAKDWSKTPLGPLHAWPQSLRTTVSTCLHCSFPIVTWWGPDLILIYNDAYIPILGEKHPNALGRKGRECWSEIWPIIGPMLERVLVQGQASPAEDLQLLIERGGYPDEGYFSFSYSPIYDESGGVGGIFCPVLETTEKVIGARRLETLRELAALSPAGNLDGALQNAAKVLARNGYDAPFALLYRVSDDGSTGRLASTAGIEAGRRESPVEIPMAGGGAWPLQLALERPHLLENVAERALPTGRWSQAPKQAYLAPLILPGAQSASGILVIGLNPHKRMDQSYRSFLDLVASHISARMADAVAYEAERKRAEALAEIDRAKTAFFSNISHEFRTPLTLMLGPLEEALAKVEGESREHLTVAKRSGQRLLRLVNVLLDFSRVEAGRAQASYEPTDISALTADLASNFRSACELAGLNLVVDCSPLNEPVYLDREMWEKIVLNLISNAFKFTFVGKIVVTCRAAGGCVEVAIKDTGTGIPVRELPRIFERFHRVENANSRTHEGTGIGLALVSELVKLHGGRIEASSVYGEGTTFTIRIPLGTAHLPQERIGAERTQVSTGTHADAYVEEALRWLPEEQVHPSKPEREAAVQAGGENRPALLVADDNADMRIYLRSILGSLYQVETVADGSAALEAMRRRRPALAILDVMMPRMDGFEALSQLRSDESLKDVPVILLSARAGEEAKAEGLAAGADDYVVKPFNSAELLARIHATLAMVNLRNEAAAELRESEERYRSLFEHMLDGAAYCQMLYDEHGKVDDFVCLAVNEAFEHITGITGAAGKRVTQMIPQIKEQHPEVFEIYGRVASTGRPERFEIEFKPLGRHLSVSAYSPAKGFFVVVFDDITERKRQEEQIRLLLREVNHRAKNMLSLVQAVARQTAASNPEEFLERFSERIQALATSQDLLVKGEWKGVDLAELVRLQLAHFQDLVGTRIELKGPSLLITAPAAQTLGMAVHELATNAGKYGALFVAGGRVAIEWTLECAPTGDETFAISWRESGGPQITKPSKEGFGSKVIGPLAESSLDAHVDLKFLKTGLSWRLRCPAAGVIEGTRPKPEAKVTSERNGPSKRRAKVLVVEDEALVAMEIAHVLKKADFEVLGPARAVAPALAIIEESGCDAAVLDINLGGETSEAVARKLLAEGARFVTLSGYAPAQHPPIFEGVPALAKPLRPELLVQEIKRCLAG